MGDVVVVINCEPMETRVAVLEDGRLEDFEVEREAQIKGSVFKGVVRNVVGGMDAAFVDIGLKKNGFLYVGDIVPGGAGVAISPGDSFSSIAELVRVGDEVMVQVARPGGGGKGPRLTTRISLAGKYVILLAQGADHVAISQKITSDSERERLRRIGERLRPFDQGLVIRTEAAGRSQEEIAQEVEALRRLWTDIVRRFSEVPAPALLYHNPGIMGRVLLDIAPKDTRRIAIDSHDGFQRLKSLAKELTPEFESRIELYEGISPIFEHFNVEPQLRLAWQRVVDLPSGGSLVIDEAEAFTTIDVNTGHFVGTTDAADTILQTNLEAVSEIARQLRLRDIGGIIVIDFIDVLRARDRIRVMNALERALQRDRAQTKIVSLSPLGLVELTRQRRGESLWQLAMQPCPHCFGIGRIKTPLTVSLELRRQIQAFTARRWEGGDLSLVCHPEVAVFLIGEEDEGIAGIERKLRRQIFLFVNDELHVEKFSISFARPEQVRQGGELQPGEVVEVDLTKDGYPKGEPLYVVVNNQLVRLPSQEAPLPKRVSLLIRSVHRWYAQAELLPEEGSAAKDAGMVVA